MAEAFYIYISFPYKKNTEMRGSLLCVVSIDKIFYGSLHFWQTSILRSIGSGSVLAPPWVGRRVWLFRCHIHNISVRLSHTQSL
jgi:hypothetical protein